MRMQFNHPWQHCLVADRNSVQKCWCSYFIYNTYSANTYNSHDHVMNLSFMKSLISVTNNLCINHLNCDKYFKWRHNFAATTFLNMYIIIFLHIKGKKLLKFYTNIRHIFLLISKLSPFSKLFVTKSNLRLNANEIISV